MGIPSMVMKNNSRINTAWYEVSVQILLKENMDALEFNEVILDCPRLVKECVACSSDNDRVDGDIGLFIH